MTLFALLPFALGVLVTCIAIPTLYLSYKRSQKRYKTMHAAAKVASLSPDAIHHLFSKQQGGLPAWLRSPDASQATWLNAMMEVLWPFIDRAGTEWAFKDRNLETLLNSQTFWKPAWLAASGVVLQGLVMGHVPPQVTGVKVYPPVSGGTGGQEALVADFTFDWASKMQVQLAMKTLEGYAGMSVIDRLLSVVYRAVRVKVVVQDLVARGQLRVVISPLLGTLPVVGAVRVSFLEPPAISYRVSSFGANPLIIPGLEAWLNSFIAEQVLSPFTFPEGFTINVAELFGMTIMPPPVRPEGVLSVTIKRALNVPRTDFFGLSDPYVKLYLTKKVKHRTSVKGTTLSPVWNEQFEFVVHSTDHQRLHLELWDSDAFNPDDEIGRVEVPLSSLELEHGHVNSLSLVIQRPGKPSKRRKPSPGDDSDEELPAGNGNIGRRSGQQPQTHTVEATVPQNMGEIAPAPPSGEIDAAPDAHQAQRSNRVQRTSAPKDMVHKLADIGRKKECTLDVDLQFVPFTSHEAKMASDVATGLQPRMSMVPDRLRRLLRGGMLYVNLTRAEGLPSNKGRLTRKFRIKVKVGPRDASPVLKKTAERTGIGRGLDARNPVFDQSLDFLVDGDLADRSDTVVRVELWTMHMLLRPSYRGCVAVPLTRVIAASRLHDTFPLHDSESGRLEMTLEWLGTVDTL